MLSELSKIGLSAEAIYFLDCNNHKEYLQRKAEVKIQSVRAKIERMGQRRANEAQKNRDTKEKPKKIHK